MVRDPAYVVVKSLAYVVVKGSNYKRVPVEPKWYSRIRPTRQVGIRKPSGCLNQTTFTVDGFDKWKKVRNGKACTFLGHMRKDNVSSLHCNAEKAHIHVVLLLALQGIPFRGHDEKSSSSNSGNFLEFLDVLTIYNDELSKAIAKAPKNVKYRSHDIQKQILHVLSVRVKNTIREEIGVAKYCIIVDEAWDESKREQMSIVLRLVHVSDTMALTLKDAIYSALAHYNLDLQLALVAATKNVTPIHQFFDRLTFIVNIVGSSCKRNDELKNAHADDIAYLIAINELETGRGFNQIGTLQRAIDTRWSSHLRSLKDLIKMFSASCTVSRVWMISFLLVGDNQSVAGDFTELPAGAGFLTTEWLSEQSVKAAKSARTEELWIYVKSVEKFYARDFTRDGKEQLEMQLKHYEYNVVKGSNYKNLSTISELCQWLVKTNKSITYNLIFRMIVLVLTLPVSMATSERSFSTMNIVKSRLRSKMEDAFLSDVLMVYIEREIARNVSIEAIIEDFENLKERRIPFS
ncbi:uncharacterized protein LOC121972337 [Zingiber officinale]|uniref:uncharacterized protein LOC121972337 n=1 Tax=Zingiber officinale TaxID=94328 RepID=UPI001C4D5268|nr:uncharacterized protein LOC121972337 [Zingiber officinale]